MSRKMDPDIKTMSLAELRREVMKLRHQTRKVRDKMDTGNDNDKCWAEEAKLFLLLPEKTLPSSMELSENPEVLIQNCRRYWRRQCGKAQILALIGMKKKKSKSQTLRKA